MFRRALALSAAAFALATISPAAGAQRPLSLQIPDNGVYLVHGQSAKPGTKSSTKAAKPAQKKAKPASTAKAAHSHPPRS